MAKSQEKERAIRLRGGGESIKAIAKKVGVSRSTASVWCREITLTKQQAVVLRLKMISAGNVGRMKGRDANIARRQNNVATEIERAQKMVGEISHRDIIMLGLGLYWGEGSKKNERRFIFTNSDALIIQCMMSWLNAMKISRTEIVGQIYINEQHAERIKIVEEYWLSKLALPRKQLRKSILIKTPHKKYYANKNTYFGTFRLMVKKSSTLQYLTMGLLGSIASQV